MKNIQIFNADKYNGPEYTLVEENIYKKENRRRAYKFKNRTRYITEGFEMKKKWYEKEIEIIETEYFTSLSFEAEPELGENEPTDEYVSQYPLDDILDKFLCSVSDSYDELNRSDNVRSYVEFCSDNIECIKKILELVGKHVYNLEADGRIKLIIE